MALGQEPSSPHVTRCTSRALADVCPRPPARSAAGTSPLGRPPTHRSGRSVPRRARRNVPWSSLALHPAGAGTGTPAGVGVSCDGSTWGTPRQRRGGVVPARGRLAVGDGDLCRSRARGTIGRGALGTGRRCFAVRRQRLAVRRRNLGTGRRRLTVRRRDLGTSRRRPTVRRRDLGTGRRRLTVRRRDLGTGRRRPTVRRRDLGTGRRRLTVGRRTPEVAGTAAELPPCVNAGRVRGPPGGLTGFRRVVRGGSPRDYRQARRRASRPALPWQVCFWLRTSSPPGGSKRSLRRGARTRTSCAPPTRAGTPSRRAPRRVPWSRAGPSRAMRASSSARASLLRRVHLVDVLSCPCGGRRALLADVTDAATVAAILAHIGLATEPPLVARARDPSADAA